ncbi:MAG: ABC transporter permease [Candidatus Aenigmarchaeota archaeon]|nr:ABC transporter permease [Candidatus Aenigmarchaeota archaeon]
MTNLIAIYVLWLREMKRFLRAKSRVVGTLAMPLFFLAFLGIGFNRMSMPGLNGTDYIHFLVPGIIGMTMLFTSMFSGMSVLWDREFGFLKEIMVAPVDRISIVLGRTLGGVTTSVIQGILILGISIFMGFKLNGLIPFLLSVVFMMLASTTFIGLGLIFASRMRDIHGFSLIVNFVIFPLFFLSGALYPIDNMPSWIKIFSYVDPLTYSVDGMRGALINISTFSIAFDFLISLLFAALMILLGAYSFESSESI